MTQIEKRAREAYEIYKQSEIRTLREAYGSYSKDKDNAMTDCRVLCRELGGSDLKIITYNRYVFTAGFEFTNEEGKKMFMYITPSYNTTIEVK